MAFEQRQQLRAIVERMASKRRVRAQNKNLVDTADDYIEHYRLYGWRYFTRNHCPARIYDQVARAAPKEAA